MDQDLTHYRKRHRYYLHYQVKLKTGLVAFRKSYTCTVAKWEEIMHDEHLVELMVDYKYSVQLIFG